ncbi:cytochrome b2 [Colletotrichum orchidophilum]|uniref:L-lactate dehydrogenase (cytochrome) n=1 Tax=Colletotrichum orchidophilum TaxID=1209926 RepID=A0A1G4BGZ0_9PEZI|nr:cytochrome b2 [Colletotrichum orchidophilum]OHF00635.1 cytochrome b2 [Colletotrichum orchidophilum]
MTTKTLESEKATISVADLSKHNTKSDCWIAVHSKVWDITDFINEHPGGPSVLLKCAGSNATKIFDEVHAPDILEELPDEKFIGILKDATPDVPAAASQPETKNGAVSAPAETAQTSSAEEDTIPPLEAIIGAPDLEVVASKAMTPKTWAFYSSAATDLITHKNNKQLVRRIMIRPRILRNVSHVDMKTNILGLESAAPFFISPAAMAKLVHPDGELALSRGAANEGIIQCISSNASYTLKSIVSAAPPTQPFFFQLYINSERHKTIEILRSARALGIKAIFVTVDAPVPGKREADERAAQAGTIRAAISGAESSKDKKGSGLGRLMAQYIDKSITWEDLTWIREASGVPIVLKGVQTADDVRLAVEYGVEAVFLSNHGGRSLDGSQASILVLLELREQCPEIFEKLEVYIDGGFERGSDILKAIALGATAVGVGRPFLYSLVYGQDGVEHLSQILKDELETSMRLCGITSLSQATPAMVNTLDIDHLVVSEDRARQKRPLRRPRSKL